MADQDKVYHPDDKTPCPYKCGEMIAFKHMPYHLIKCRKKRPSPEYYTTCPLNVTHVVPMQELRYHLNACPEIAKFESERKSWTKKTT